MKRFAGSFILVLGILIAAASCNGANDVTGPDPGLGSGAPTTPNPVVTPHPHVTPNPRNPCRQNPADC